MLQENLAVPHNCGVRPHHDMMSILFKHKSIISQRLSSVIGLFNIDHISIKFINPHNELVIFSSTPSVEFNLILNNMWQYDKSFFPDWLESGSLFWWENAYVKEHSKALKQTKEAIHGYTLGWGISQQIDKLRLIYSYATRSPNEDLKSYYTSFKNELLLVGNYAFKLLRDIYSLYAGENRIIRPYLKLVVDNQK